MTHQTLFKTDYDGIGIMILTGIVCVILLSCSPHVNFTMHGMESRDSASVFSSPPDTLSGRFESFMEKHMYMGFGVGPETGLSLMLPKMSYYHFQDRKILSTYYGLEGGLGLLTVPWFSLDCLYGIKKDIFTLDASLGAWWYPKRTSDEKAVGPYFHSTINPKVGIRFWEVWLKAGPSFHIYRDYPEEEKPIGMIDLVKIGKMYFNFEILIKL